MRLHLVIQRHGLPVTRVLWTTSAPDARPSALRLSAFSSAIASPRTPNAVLGENAGALAFGSGGLTIAQLLEDVNEVIPLECEMADVGHTGGGQWALEDYVVEVMGSECLHFMQVDGLLRDGDEVV